MVLRPKELDLKKEEIAYDLIKKLDEEIVNEIDLTYDKIIEYVYFILEYISASIELSNDQIIIDYLLWLKTLLENNGMAKGILENNLEGLNHMVFKHTNNKKIAKVINKAIHSLENATLENTDDDTSDYLLTEADRYLKLVLNQEKEKARALINELVEERETPIHHIYYYIFERTQIEVGKLWEKDLISVSDEHYVSAFTKRMISNLFSRFYEKAITKKKVLLMAIENEIHDMGIQMIADIFAMDGWDAQYFGRDLPIDDILLTIKKNKPYIVVISATFSKNIVYVKRLISMLKREGIKTKVFVGGNAFNKYPYLAKDIGADYYTKKFNEIIETANELLKTEKRR